MSKFREKLASFPDFEIIGYEAFKGVNILFNIETNDNQLKDKIIENNLDAIERNFIVSTVNEYLVDTIQQDEKLFNYAVTDIIIDYMEGNMDLPTELIDLELLNGKCSVKGEFNKTKFKSLPLNQKLEIVKDLDDFISYVWTNYYHENRDFDIKNLVNLPYSDMVEYEQRKEAKTSSLSNFRKILNSLK